MEKDVPGFPDSLNTVLATVRFLLSDAASSIYVVACEGIITECNQAFATALDAERDNVIGSRLSDVLTQSDRRLLTRQTGNAAASSRGVLVNFSYTPTTVVTFKCRILSDESCTLIVGEAPDDEGVDFHQQMMAMNQELATANRELARKQREIERTRKQLQHTVDELNESYWHLKKIQEVLPICMNCDRVKTGEAQWENVIDYLKENSLFLSHGYCPECAEQVRSEWQTASREMDKNSDGS